jgi:hypothetical protein
MAMQLQLTNSYDELKLLFVDLSIAISFFRNENEIQIIPGKTFCHLYI